MNISFQCDVCSQTLSANAIAAGRVITCPYCHNTTTIPQLKENEEQGQKRQRTLDEKDADGDASTSPDATQWRDPTFDPDWEKMLENFPNFKPNPFGISFPLDQAIQKSQEEFDEEKQGSDDANVSTTNQYSVDDLIKGVE